MKIPQLLLRQLYTFGSLTNTIEGARISLKNRLSDVTLTRILGVRIGTVELSARELEVDLGDGKWRPATAITPGTRRSRSSARRNRASSRP